MITSNGSSNIKKKKSRKTKRYWVTQRYQGDTVHERFVCGKYNCAAEDWFFVYGHQN